jgi:hypothetical protein
MVDLNEVSDSKSKDPLELQANDSTSLDEEVSKEMSEVAKRLDLQGVGTNPPQDLQDCNAPSTSLITPTNIKFPVVPYRHSALKGTRSMLLTSRATFTNHTTILNNLEIPSIEEPHNEYTEAKLACTRVNFHRTSPWYRKGTWASSDGVEKDDTSFMRMAWFE